MKVYPWLMQQFSVGELSSSPLMIQGLGFVILWSCALLAASESSASCGPVRDNGWKSTPT